VFVRISSHVSLVSSRHVGTNFRQRLLDWVGVFEDLINLLKGVSLGLDEGEVDDNSGKGVEDQVESIELPGPSVNSINQNPTLDNSGGVDEQLAHGHSLGTGRVWQDLDWVQSVQWSPCERVDNGEDLEHDPSEDSKSGLSWVVVERVQGDQDDQPADGVSNSSVQQHGTTSKLVSVGSSELGNNETNDGSNNRNSKLTLWGGPTELSVGDDRETRGLPGTSILREECNSNNESRSVSHGTSSEESSV